MAEGCWDERSALRAGLLVDAAPQIEQRHMHDAVKRSAQAGVARCVIAHLLSEVGPLESLLHRSTGLVDRFQPVHRGSLRTGWDSRGRLAQVNGHPEDPLGFGPAPEIGRHLCAPERQRVTPNSTGEPSAIESPLSGTDAVSVPSAERYTRWTVMSAPATLATLRMWPAFEVTTAWFRRTAPSTTETSTMSS